MGYGRPAVSGGIAKDTLPFHSTEGVCFITFSVASYKIFCKHYFLKGFSDGLVPLEKQGEMPFITHPHSHPILNVEFRDGIGLRMGKGISPIFFACF